MSRNFKLKEKQNWRGEKPKLDDARRLRGIYFIDLEDIEFNETIKNARRKLEVPIGPVLPCKKTNSRYGEPRCGNGDHKSKFACIMEVSESKRLRVEGILPRIHKDHTAGKESNSLHHYNLVHKFIPKSQVMKIPAAKEAADKE